MNGAPTHLRALACLAATLMLAAGPPPAQAQPARGRALCAGIGVPLREVPATLVLVTGRAELLRRGQSEWEPALPGARLPAGDEVRTGAGAVVELRLPDGSTATLAENSRLAVTRVSADAQNQAHIIVVHVAVGKARAGMPDAAISRGMSFQSILAITTVQGAAVVREPSAVVSFNQASEVTLVAALPGTGPAEAGQVIYGDLADRAATVLAAGTFLTHTGRAEPSAPVSISTLPPAAQAALGAPVSPETAGQPGLQAPGPVVGVIAPDVVLAILCGPPPLVLGPDPPLVPAPPSSVGRGILPQQSCASPPCP